MNESVFGSGLDMEAYLAQRSLEIQNLKDRALFKEVVDKLVLELYHYTQQEYQDLEARVFQEVQSGQNDYAVYIGIVDMDHYDATDPFLKPMVSTDTERQNVSLDDLLAALREKKPYHLFTVFLEAPYSIVRGFQGGGQSYSGIIRTDRGEHSARFSVSINKTYLNKIEALYHIFGANYRAWTTVCAAYLYKMFDVAVTTVDVISSDEAIREIKVDFGEYAEHIRYDMIPLWNLNTVLEKTSTYPEPCMDKTNYDHRIFSYKLDDGCQYLVANTDIEITNIRRLDGDLVISCPAEDPCQWILYQVNQCPARYKARYPVLSNRCKESFAGSLGDIYRKSVKTRAEIARLIESFDYGDYLAFQGIELLEGEGTEQSYDMDDFISDELRVGEAKQRMQLTFVEKEPGNMLNMDVMSFLVTQVQKLFPEYHCQGRLV